MADNYLNYDGQLVDDEPLAVVLYATTWRKYLLGLALALRDEEFWKPNALIDDAVAQADAFTTLLLGEPDVIIPSFPHHATIFFGEAVINYGLLTPIPIPYPGQVFSVVWYQSAPANGDEFFLTANLANGNYHLTLIGVRYLQNGKSEIHIDGVLVAGSLFDWYDAGEVMNVMQTLNITIAEKGFHNITVKVNGKNPASTGYVLTLSALILRYR